MQRLISILLLGLTQALAQPSIEQAEWPAPTACQAGSHVQFDRLAFRVPKTLADPILIPDIGVPALVLSPSTNPDKSIQFTHERVADIQKILTRLKLADKPGFDNPATLFLTLVHGRNTAAENTLRTIFGIDGARHQLLYKGSQLSAYLFIHDTPPLTRAYVIPDDGRKVYKISGNIPPRTFEQLLACMHLADS